MRSRSWRRSQIWSIARARSRNSERWKPSGRVSRTVCSITRGPAKPISASGSAMLMSPSIAKDADTPPVVGWVITEMYGRPAARRRPSAADVLAICISENRLSCMRAPPLAAKHTKGHSSSSARSAASAKRSPTTDPIEPPMKAKSKAQATIGRCLSLPSSATSASRSPVAFCGADAVGVLLLVAEPEHVGRGQLAADLAQPVRIGKAASRAAPGSGGGTRTSGRPRGSLQFRSYRTAPQRSHFSHSPSGALRLRSRRCRCRMRGGTSFFSQLMRGRLPSRQGPPKRRSLAHGRRAPARLRAQSSAARSGAECRRTARRLGGIGALAIAATGRCRPPRRRRRGHGRGAGGVADAEPATTGTGLSADPAQVRWRRRPGRGSDAPVTGRS